MFTASTAPRLMRSVAGLSQWRPAFDPRPVNVSFVVDKLALGQVFSPSTSVYPLSVSFYRRSVLQLVYHQRHIILIIGLTSLNKYAPQPCFISGYRRAWQDYGLNLTNIISGFCRRVAENCIIQGYYAASSV